MTADEQIRQFPPNVARGQVIEIARLLGFPRNTVRQLIEGPGASLKGRQLGSKRTYWRKDEVVKTFS